MLVPVDSATVINAGDLTWRDSGGELQPASTYPWQGSLAATQAAFASEFIGIALDSSAAGQSTPVEVNTNSTAIWPRTVASATYNVGTPLGPGDSGGSSLTNTLVTVVSDGLAIARAVEFKLAPATTLRVTFASAWTTNSSNTNASIG